MINAKRQAEKRQAEKRKPPIFNVFGVTRSGIEPRHPAPRADSLTTVLRGGGHFAWVLCHILVYQTYSYTASMHINSEASIY